MGISAVSSASFTPPPQGNPSAIKQAFDQLTSALQSGDLQSAQSAYQTLSQSPMGSDPNSPFAKALSQIGDALQSGDTGKAQQALAQLQQQMQAMRGHHHHHAKPADAGDPSQVATQSDPAAATPVADTSSNLVNVTA
jgi:DNA-binding FadR family transcriptional regulator